jgi:Ca2+-transporting ATPase
VARPRQRANVKTLLRAEIVHDAVAGRVRFRHLGLVAREDLVGSVQEALRRCPGVTAVRASSLTGSILLEFGAPATVKRLAAAIDAVAAGRTLRPLGTSRSARALSAAAMAGAPNPDQAWHGMPAGEAAAQLRACLHVGLDPDEAARRLILHGRNELLRAEGRWTAAIFAEQLTSFPVALLGISAALSLLTGGIADAAVIATVVLLNAGVATATERQAERTILGMSDYALRPVAVARGGARRLVDPAQLVPGDLVLLERGTLVPADARLVTCDDLTVNESALTGEALPVHKDAEIVLPPDTALPDRRNMVFRGTGVTGGSGAALIIATGQATEIGRVQQLLGSLRPPETPIQRQLGEVGRDLVLVNGLICAAVFGLGILQGHRLVAMLRSAISLAVAAIPEGLPAVATTTLAIGVQDMRRRNVLVRKLDAVETLGAAEVVGLDKTGTLTENRMAVVAVHADGALLTLAQGRLTLGEHEAEPARRAVACRLFEVAALCSDAIVRPAPERFLVDGSPTESALVEGAIALGTDVTALRLSAPVLASVPRSFGRIRMATLHEGAEGGRLLCVKGDPLEVLGRCTARRTADGVVPLDDEARRSVLKANERMAGQALRVLGVAVSENGGDPRDEQDLVWLGLAGLANPIRPSVVPALKRLHRAGVRTLMITGDQSATAFAVARDLDLGDGGELTVLEAGQINGLRPDVLAALVAQPQVFARVSPVDKLNIVKALQTDGHIVAMTGDGINDGPALRAADIGIAMGGEGTDVAREVADIVLAQDDLDGIIEAIRLGRATYANIRKVLRYLVSTNASETFVMLGAALAGAGEPLTPLQLLWLNLASDPLPALALGLEEPEADVLDQPPHDARAPILSAGDFRHILREGVVLGTATLAGYFLAGGAGAAERASTITFHGLTLAQLVHAIACRSETHGIAMELYRPPSPKLYGALAASAALQVAAQISPTTRRLFGLAPVGFTELVGILGIAFGSAVLNDIIGYVFRGEGSPARPPTL